MAEDRTRSFERSYWTEASHYRKFAEYEAGLRATTAWYEGFLRLVAADLPAGRRALDAGTGHGAIVHLLLREGYDATGLDVSAWMIEEARAARPELAGRFVVGDVSALPEGDRFDLITCLEVLEHVEDPVAVLQGFAGRLAPGGRVIATTPNLRPLMPWWDPLTSDPTHINVHEPSWWAGAARAAGLDVLRVSTFVTVPVVWRLGPAFSRWIPLGRRTGPGVLLVAERAASG